MLLAILSDSHFGCRNSSQIFLDHTAEFYKNTFFPYCEKHGIKQILHLGDFFDHRKYINFIALNHTRRTFLEPLVKAGMTMDIIPGNHDVTFKNTNDLCSLKELLGYFVENVNIVMKPKVMNYSGCKIALLPWINIDNYAESIKFLETCQATILGAHLELAGFEMAKGQPPASHGMDDSCLKRFEMVLSGHYHTKSTRDNIHYLGTQYEMTWADCDDPKFFHVLDTETRQLTAVRNQSTIYEKLYYDDRSNSYADIDLSHLSNKFVKVIVSNKTKPAMFEKFIDLVQEAKPNEIKIAESFEELTGENVESLELDTPTETSDLLNLYVDASDTDLDKSLIKSKLNDLYIEAQSV